MILLLVFDDGNAFGGNLGSADVCGETSRTDSAQKAGPNERMTGVGQDADSHNIEPDFFYHS